MNNPYSAPGADLSVENNGKEEYQPKIFTWSGRIGRLRYLGYSFLVTMAIYAVMGVAGALLVGLGFMGAGVNPVAIGVLGFVAAIVLFSFTLMPIKRRLNDLNQSGWMGLLMLIPLVNVFFGLYLLFGRGTDGTNNFGPMPCKNPRGMIFVAFLLPVMVIAVMAAVAVPVYQEMLKKERAAAIEQAEDAQAESADAADPADPAASADPAAPADTAAPTDAAAPAEPAAKP